MLRDINLKSKKIMDEAVASFSEMYYIWEHKMKELKQMKESERNKAHWTIKIIQGYFNKRGGLSI